MAIGMLFVNYTNASVKKLHNYELYIIIRLTMVSTVVIARELHANE